VPRGAEGDATGSAPGALRARPAGWLAVLGGLALAGGLWTLQIRASGPAAGLFHDGGVYLVTAHALAAGDGYRMTGTPGAPAAVRYPPVYPLALAGAWRLAPRFPDDLPLLKAVGLLAALALVVALAAMLPGFGIPPAAAFATAAMTAVAPLTMAYATAIASELPFALAALLALSATEAATRRSGWTRAAGAGALAGVAFLTRSLGIAVVGAGAVALLRRADGRRALAFVLGAAPAVVGWAVWLALHRGGGGTSSYAAALAHDGVPGPAAILEHLVALPAAVGLVTLPGVADLLPEPAPWPALLAVYAAGAGILVAALRRSYAGYVGLTLAIAVAVPWFQPRFLVPLAPLFLASMLAGRTRRTGAALVAALFVLALAGDAVRLAGARRSGLPALEAGSAPGTDWPAIARALAWLDEHAAPGDVLAGFQDPLLHLYTHRQAVQVYPSIWRPDGGQVSTALAGTHARWLVDIPPPDGGTWAGARAAWTAWLAEHAPTLTPAYTDPASGIRVWRLAASVS